MRTTLVVAAATFTIALAVATAPQTFARGGSRASPQGGDLTDGGSSGSDLPIGWPVSGETKDGVVAGAPEVKHDGAEQGDVARQILAGMGRDDLRRFRDDANRRCAEARLGGAARR